MRYAVWRWLGRNGFALWIVLALPAIFLTFSTVINGVTPDGRPPLIWPGTDACARYADAQERRACMLPTLGRLPLAFEWNWTPGDAATQPRPPLSVLAEDVRARYAFAIPAGLLILFSVPVVCIGFAGLADRALAYWPLVAVGGGAAAAMAGLHFQHSHPIRILNAEHLLWLAATDGGYAFLTEDTWAFAFRAVDATMVAAMVSAAVLITLFAALSTRASPPLLTHENLRHRARWLKIALGLGSLMLVLVVAATHGLLHWSTALMAPGSREPLGSLASSAALYWGVINSLTLVMVAVPTIVAIRLDAERLTQQDGAAPGELLERIGLNFDLRRLVVTVTTVAGPLLTGPALDLLETVGFG